MHNLMCEEVAVYAEVPVAECTLISATIRRHPPLGSLALPLLSRRDIGE
jgi:hypothetical protein